MTWALGILSVCVLIDTIYLIVQARELRRIGERVREFDRDLYGPR